ncbi:MAG TPA: RHS repeat-associated core domain-containing protein [Anaerohalosphaeraceae bacterium]|nr:RHS repeat-associated core domain-containing protein [Anaerohalosphaeraceae bacterium]
MVQYVSGNGNRFYSYADALGSIRLLSDSAGNIKESYTYDPYGRPRVMRAGGADGNWLTEDTAVYASSHPLLYGNPYLFTGRRWDSTTELYYYRMRDYSPDAGWFMQAEPAGYIDGMNLYAYCGNNPINWIDPWGLDKLNTGSLNPPEGFPKPPGWTPDWEWIPTDDPRGGGEWKDRGGGTWRPHPDPGGEHGGDHYDYTPPGRRGRKYRKKIGSDGSEIAKKNYTWCLYCRRKLDSR